MVVIVEVVDVVEVEVLEKVGVPVGQGMHTLLQRCRHFPVQVYRRKSTMTGEG